MHPLIGAEVASAVRGLLLTTRTEFRITEPRADEMLEDFADLPIVRYPMQPLQHRVLALRHNCTAYDAFYMALAESLGMPLLTDDSKFAGAPAQAASIEVWGD